MNRCRRCGAQIRFERTWPNRRSIPLDPEPAANGNVRLVELDDDQVIAALAGVRPGAAVTLGADERHAARVNGWELYVHHRATCTVPAAPRKRDRKQR